MIIRKYGVFSIISKDVLESGGIHPYHYEVLYIAEGTCQLFWINGIYTVTGPALFFITPNTPHLLSKNSETCRYLFLEVELQNDVFLTDEDIIQWNEMQSSLLSPSYELDSIYQTMDSVHNHLTSTLSTTPSFINQLISIELQKTVLLIKRMLELSIKPIGSRVTKREDWDAARAMDILAHYLECYYQQELTLQNLAKFVSLNPSYLIRLFKQHKGITPFQYLNTIRMNAAVSYLKNSELSIQKISTITGFQSIHYFSRAFKLQYGHNPTNWRKLQLDEH